MAYVQKKKYMNPTNSKTVQLLPILDEYYNFADLANTPHLLALPFSIMIYEYKL